MNFCLMIFAFKIAGKSRKSLIYTQFIIRSLTEIVNAFSLYQADKSYSHIE